MIALSKHMAATEAAGELILDKEAAYPTQVHTLLSCTVNNIN